jgi:V8-like Glu-specific endopeptidase
MSLLTYSQQQTIKAISANNQSKYAQLEKEVEDNELRRLLGVEFLQDITTHATSEPYKTLVEGGDFENSNGNTVTHKGLQFVLAYMVYSKYIGESFITDTFSGFVQKTRTDSEGISEGTIRRLQEETRKLALTEWELIKEYLNLNTGSFTLWNSTYKKLYRPRIFGIQKVNYGRL